MNKIKVTVIESVHPLGTQNGIDYGIYPSEEN